MNEFSGKPNFPQSVASPLHSTDKGLKPLGRKVSIIYLQVFTTYLSLTTFLGFPSKKASTFLTVSASSRALESLLAQA